VLIIGDHIIINVCQFNKTTYIYVDDKGKGGGQNSWGHAYGRARIYL
jgi:hypothetical protein